MVTDCKLVQWIDICERGYKEVKIICSKQRRIANEISTHTLDEEGITFRSIPQNGAMVTSALIVAFSSDCEAYVELFRGPYLWNNHL